MKNKKRKIKKFTEFTKPNDSAYYSFTPLINKQSPTPGMEIPIKVIKLS